MYLRFHRWRRYRIGKSATDYAERTTEYGCDFDRDSVGYYQGFPADLRDYFSSVDNSVDLPI